MLVKFGKAGGDDDHAMPPREGPGACEDAVAETGLRERLSYGTRAQGDGGGQAGGHGRDHAARAAPGAGALAGGDPTMWARGHHAGTVGPGEPIAGRHVRRQSDGGRTGWRECPRRGPAAAATRPSRQCRCRGGPLWGVTKAPGYAGGSLLVA